MELGRVKLFKLLIWLFIVFSFCFSVFTIGRILLTFDLHDFAIYFRGIKDLLAGINPYINKPGEVIYPPIALLLLSPLGYFSQNVAENIWTIISVISLLVSIALLLRLLEIKIVWKHFLLIWGLATLSFPMKFNFGMGQINLVLLLLICASFYAYQRNKHTYSGALLGLASALKFIPLPLFIYFIKKRQYKLIVIGLAFFAFLQIIPWFLINKEINIYFWQQVFPHLPTVGNDAYYNQAFTGWLARLKIIPEIARWLNYGLFVGLLSGAWKVTKSKKEKVAIELLEYGLLVTIILIGAGLAWQHYFVLLLIPFTPLLLRSIKQFNKLKWYLLATFIAYLLISWNIKYPENFIGINSLLLSHVLYGAILLYGVIWLNLYQKKI